MAGSYLHVVKDDGSLRSNKDVADMLENGGDVFEAVEEMYGMIWQLADALVWETGTPNDRDEIADRVELARQNYQEGLRTSPTKRYRG